VFSGHVDMLLMLLLLLLLLLMLPVLTENITMY
jgi:hypothetical protein